MSDVPATHPAAPVEKAVEPTTTAPTTASTTEETPAVAESTPDAVKSEETPAAAAAAAPVEAAPVEDKVDETPAAAPVEEATEEVKTIEPVSEGFLGYKAPGLLKQFTFSKKEFWLSEYPVAPQQLDLYLRGEKSEISHPVVAWASQSGTGLLFFNKKTDSDRKHPAGVLALYDATDLKKSPPHEFSFELHGQKHQFKAANDAERDGWYLAVEKAIELGKASKDSVRASEGYKSEIEKLNTPNLIGGTAVATKPSQQTSSKKSVDGTEPTRTGSSEGEDGGLKKKVKSRSTSRGVLNRLKGKKDEAEAKHEIKKEEKEEAKEEKKIEKADEVAPETATAATVLGTSAPLDAPGTADRAVGAPVAESKPEETAEAAPTTPVETKAEEKPKVSKRGSIFGRIPSAWNSIKSPGKEKDQKESELKPEVPPKDTGVSESAPQLPETATTEPIEPAVASAQTSAPEVTEPVAADPPKTADTTTPNKEKKNFLSGLPFLNKRDRSVSPSALKDSPVVSPVKEDSVPTEPAKVEEPVPVTPAAAPVESAEKPVEPVEESKATEATPSTNKRQSVLGSIGRRASKALNRINTPKKENATPTTEPKVDDAVPSIPTAEKAPETIPSAPSVEENKPEAVGVSSKTPVTASA